MISEIHLSAAYTRLFVFLCLLLGLQGCATPPTPFNEAGLWGLKDTRENVIVPPSYELEPRFSNGLGLVRTNKKWGFIDHEGTLVIPAIYDKIELPSMGLIGACRGDYGNRQCGYIDTSGQTIIAFEYSSAESFTKEQDGLAQVTKGRKHGAIRRDGSVVIPIIYDERFIIQDGYVLATLGGRSLVLTTSGEEVLKPYDVIAYDVWGGKIANKGLFTVASEGKWGFVNTKGEIVIPFKYDKRAFFGRRYAIVSRDGERFRIDRHGVEEPLNLETLPIPY
ncbi:WG repeat-containing protein [Pseudomonas stutzeri]|uniref:WG repeat-containing protein n=1 Tax=Stutzerimonas stutzeri TaxID=316 RepID=UPI00210A4080|nr:WG repeat-containing protein [Stutzerimonas stutzeri]MCQ4289555.1 WG repeat-containing protein [Stutzerimonas stutzeri]